MTRGTDQQRRREARLACVPRGATVNPVIAPNLDIAARLEASAAAERAGG